MKGYLEKKKRGNRGVEEIWEGKASLLGKRARAKQATVPERHGVNERKEQEHNLGGSRLALAL